MRQSVKVWYRDRDKKVAIGNVARVMKDYTIKIIGSGTYNFMTNADVVVGVPESVAQDWAMAGQEEACTSLYPVSFLFPRRRGRRSFDR